MMPAPEGRPVWHCGKCSTGDLECMNRVVMDLVRCCQECDGHGIPVTDKGRELLAYRAPAAPQDGITLMILMVAAARAAGGA